MTQLFLLFGGFKAPERAVPLFEDVVKNGPRSPFAPEAQSPKAVIEVENFYYAVSQYAQTTMRNIVGEVTLDELLAQRDKIAERIKEIVDKETDEWGIKVNNVDVPYEFVARRMGDIDVCYADPSKAEKELTWKAMLGLEDMVRDAWNFEKNN